jgi:hypothetical protein
MADFKLGRIKFKWRGDWSTSTAYLIDDVVKYGGNVYVATTNHTSQSTSAGFYTDIAKWSLQSEALFFKGTYAADTHYKLNDVVRYGNRQFRCTTQHTSASEVSGTAILNESNFEIYLDGLDFKGNYATSTYYKVNDVVKYGGNQYKCITAHTSSASAGAFDETKFVTFADGLQFEDSWSSGVVYQKGDIVTYGGYAYIATQEVQNTIPVATASEWDLLVPGFKAQGDYSSATDYKTGDVVNFGGNSFVCIVDTYNDGSTIVNPTSTSFWAKIGYGLKYNGAYSAVTTYHSGDVVRYLASTFVAIADNIINVQPDSDGTKWQLIAQGDTNSVLTTRGDLVYQNAAAAARLPIGLVGSVLSTDGTDPIWSNPEGSNVLYVANSGSDSNPGTQFLPYKTINKALNVASHGDIVTIDTITGGTGGIPGTYIVDTTDGSVSGGSGNSSKFRVTLDGSSTPTIEIVNGGNEYAAGDTITIQDISNSIGGATNITFNVVSASIGDIVIVKNGVYREQLPLVVPSGVTVRGESLRGTEIRPASGSSSTIATVSIVSGGIGGSAGVYKYLQQNSILKSDGSTVGLGAGGVFNVTTDGSSTPTVTVYHGGFHYEVGDRITILGTQLGTSSDLILEVTALENNNASYMFLVNNVTNITLMTMKGMDGTAVHTGEGAVVVSLDPTGSITQASPYIQDCTSVSNNVTGIKIDGAVHYAKPASNKSILANDFTQINSDGIGIWALNGGRGEMVSVFTYYCAKSYYCTGGGFIRGLNCSSAYGEKGAEADGTLNDGIPNGETVLNVESRGYQLKYQPATISTGSTSSVDAGDIVIGQTSGARAKIFYVQVAQDTIFIEDLYGNFIQGEVLTVEKANSTTYTMTLNTVYGDSTAAQTGLQGFLIPIYSTDGSLSDVNAIKLGSNLTFAGNPTYYRISAVTETNGVLQRAIVRLTEGISSIYELQPGTAGTISTKFSNVRLTGHDFLDIGTGDFTTSNYPGFPSQPADQSDEVEELNGGRVYFSSTDQDGDFRVGDLFRIQQSTGIATLNADAFDLSGLTELQLGSIGAEIGATINEFSTDETMGGNSPLAVPTEFAVRGFLLRDKMGVTAMVPPTGGTGDRPTGGDLYEGALRYNTDLTTWEGYNGAQWTGLGGGNPWSTQTSDGSTVPVVASNDRIFVDTTAAAMQINLPSDPLVGDQLRFLDLAGTFDTNNLTVGRNGKLIMGDTANLTISTENASIGLVYTGATYGWKLIENF